MISAPSIMAILVMPPDTVQPHSSSTSKIKEHAVCLRGELRGLPLLTGHYSDRILADSGGIDVFYAGPYHTAAASTLAKFENFKYSCMYSSRVTFGVRQPKYSESPNLVLHRCGTHQDTNLLHAGGLLDTHTPTLHFDERLLPQFERCDESNVCRGTFSFIVQAFQHKMCRALLDRAEESAGQAYKLILVMRADFYIVPRGLNWQSNWARINWLLNEKDIHTLGRSADNVYFGSRQVMMPFLSMFDSLYRQGSESFFGGGSALEDLQYLVQPYMERLLGQQIDIANICLDWTERFDCLDFLAECIARVGANEAPCYSIACWNQPTPGASTWVPQGPGTTSTYQGPGDLTVQKNAKALNWTFGYGACGGVSNENALQDGDGNVTGAWRDGDGNFVF